MERFSAYDMRHYGAPLLDRTDGWQDDGTASDRSLQLNKIIQIEKVFDSKCWSNLKIYEKWIMFGSFYVLDPIE